MPRRQRGGGASSPGRERNQLQREGAPPEFKTCPAPWLAPDRSALVKVPRSRPLVIVTGRFINLLASQE